MRGSTFTAYMSAGFHLGLRCGCHCGSYYYRYVAASLAVTLGFIIPLSMSIYWVPIGSRLVSTKRGGLIWPINFRLQKPRVIHRLSYLPPRNGPAPVSVGVYPLLSREDLQW